MSKTRKIRRARNARDRALRQAMSNTALARSYKQKYDQLNDEVAEINREWNYHYNYMSEKFGPHSAMFEPGTIRSDQPIREVPSFNPMMLSAGRFDATADMSITRLQMGRIRSEVDQRPNESHFSIHFFQENSGGQLTYCYSPEAREMHSNPKLMKSIIRRLVETVVHEISENFSFGGWK